MRILIVVAILSICYGKESPKPKRGIFGEGIYGAGYGLGATDLSHGSFDLSSSQGIDLGHSSLSLEAYDAGHTIDLGSSINKHITVTKNIGVPVPHPVPFPVVKKIAVPIPHAVPVPVDKPYPVQVPRPYPVPVDKPYPVPVDKPVPYPVSVPYKYPVSVPVPVAVPKPVAVPIHKSIPIAIPEPVKVFKPVPVVVKAAPAISLGSGSLGYTHLGNGAYAIGSGSLGYTGHSVPIGYSSITQNEYSSKLW